MGLNWDEPYAAVTALAGKAIAKEPDQQQRAQARMTLAFYTLLDLTRHGPKALNAPQMVARSADFVPWRPLQWSASAMPRSQQGPLPWDG
jgi:hypothetical protein